MASTPPPSAPADSSSSPLPTSSSSPPLSTSPPPSSSARPSSTDPLPPGQPPQSSTSPPPSLSGPTKKSRKPYTITKPRESWTKEEHQLFLDALKLYERDWKSIGHCIPTKSIIQIRSHAQKYFIKMNKMGMKEHIPPPRPKKRSKRPYPKSRDGKKKRKRGGDDGDDSGEGEEGDDSSEGDSESDSGDEDSDSGSDSGSHRHSTGANGDSSAEAIKPDDPPTPPPPSPPKSKSRASPTRLQGLLAASVDAMDEGDEEDGSERRKKKGGTGKAKGKKGGRKKGKKGKGGGDSTPSSPSTPSTPPSDPPLPLKRRRPTTSLASVPPSPSSFASSHVPTLPLHDLPTNASSSYEWMEGDQPMDFDSRDAPPLPPPSPSPSDPEADEDQPGITLRLHHASRDMSHFAALSQLSPVSQLSQAADLVGGQVDDGMQLSGGDEGEVGMYGPFQEDFVYPPPLPVVSYPPSHSHNTRRSAQLQTPLRQHSPHPTSRRPHKRATSTTTASASTPPTSSRPEFSKVYAFLGSFFDPSTTGHGEELEQMTPINREMVKALMHNLAVNLNTSTNANAGRDGEGEVRDPLGVSNVPSPLPLSFSPAPDFAADSPANRFAPSTSFFHTPAGGEKGEREETPPPPASASMFTPVQVTRPPVNIHTPSDFLQSTPSSEVHESRAALFGNSGRGFVSPSLSPTTGAMPSLDSPSVHLLSPRIGGQ